MSINIKPFAVIMACWLISLSSEISYADDMEYFFSDTKSHVFKKGDLTIQIDIPIHELAKSYNKSTYAYFNINADQKYLDSADPGYVTNIPANVRVFADKKSIETAVQECVESYEDRFDTLLVEEIRGVNLSGKEIVTLLFVGEFWDGEPCKYSASQFIQFGEDLVTIEADCAQGMVLTRKDTELLNNMVQSAIKSIKVNDEFVDTKVLAKHIKKQFQVSYKQIFGEEACQKISDFVKSKKVDNPETAKQESITFNTFDPDFLDKKCDLGFATDQFFGSLAVMEANGQIAKKDPIPLFRKTMKGMEINEFDEETIDIVLFYFSRLAVKNPMLIETYKKELEQSKGFPAAMLARILWYTQDKQIRQSFQNAYQSANTQEEKEYYRELFRKKDFAHIQVDTMPITRSQDIELLWAEYFITKSMRPIERIADQIIHTLDIKKIIISVEASSSLAQRGGWFPKVRQYCLSRAESENENRDIWDNIVKRLRGHGSGKEEIYYPIDRVTLADKEARALAFCAIYTKMDPGRTDVLAPYSLDGDYIEYTRGLLDESWGVYGRYELLTSMEWLVNGGHREGFLAKGQKIKTLSKQQVATFISRQDSASHTQWEIVSQYGEKFNEKSILAWDFSRFMLLARTGYEAQYLTAEEVCSLIVPAGIILQETFDSWQEYGENFVVGRWYWRGREEDHQKARKSVDALMRDVDSPWKKYSWDMPMQ